MFLSFLVMFLVFKRVYIKNPLYISEKDALYVYVRSTSFIHRHTRVYILIYIPIYMYLGFLVPQTEFGYRQKHVSLFYTISTMCLVLSFSRVSRKQIW